MTHLIKRAWDENPLKLILLSAVFFRLIAVVFAKGFGMHDDHFLVIEAAQSWVDDNDYNNWLPGSNGNTVPSGHSFFYVGFHFIIFSFLKWTGLVDPQFKMLLIRSLHSAFSLIIIILGFKIAERIHSEKTARIVGLLLSLYFFMPWLSVRNLVEVVCIPLLMIGLWMIVKQEYVGQKRKRILSILWLYFASGVILGLALSVRFQSFFFLVGLGMALLVKLKWKETLSLVTGIIVSFGLIQGSIDTYIWGRPFAEFREYVQYNIDNAQNYITGPWYNYMLLLLGILIPPVSFFIFIGFFRMWRKHLILFLPVFIFLLFHSVFPNKQERFIIPIIPFIIILGMIGWNEFIIKSSWASKRKKLWKVCWIIFWAINIILLPVISTVYSKKARVESMVYLSQYPDVRYLLIEDMNHGSAQMPPLYYLGQWAGVYEVSQDRPLDTLMDALHRFGPEYYPQYMLFFEDKNLQQRIDTLKKYFPAIKYEATIQPGLIDKLLYMMNPKNTNQTIFIYKNPD